MTADGTLYHYTLCGLDNVYLVNGYTFHETDYGRGVSIDNVSGLHRAIAEDVISRRAHLDGRELRFLRKELDLSQGGLATLLGVDAQTVARWEKGQSEMPGPADRLVRALYREHVAGNAELRSLIATLADLDDAEQSRRRFIETPAGWRSAA